MPPPPKSPRDPREPKDPNERPPAGDPNFNWRGLVLIAIAVMVVAAAFIWQSNTSARENKTWDEFVALVQDNKIDASKGLELIAIDNGASHEIRGWYLSSEPKAGESAEQGKEFKTQIELYYRKEQLQELLAGHQADPEATEGAAAKTWGTVKMNDRVENNYAGAIFSMLLPILLLVLIILFIFRQQVKMAGRGAMNFGKSRAKLLALDKNKITFKNVAGVDEAKEEVWELVEFLKDPKKFQRLGGNIPKGVLMVGPPGTGKTLLAKAIAGEADVPFFSISGSDFVEMFVGVGASRVRDMFEQGKKNAPCLIFIDEIDAVGRHRGHGLGGGHDEREQTLNALLVEMDGFDTQEGVIIIAATNRPDVLDPALLRPGRFDRQVTVDLPDIKGREEILKVHVKKVKMADDVDLAVIARATPGFSGAELANLINEAALLAARRNLNAVTLKELEEARDKVRWGKERRSLALSDKEKKVIAYHEAGHALLLALLENTDPLHKVTIIPRGPYLGAAFHLPEADKIHIRKKELLEDLIVTMGGRVAEELIFGDVTSGARGDIRQATNIAKKMVCEWGMSEDLGMVEYGEHNEQVFLARDIARSRDYSESTAQKIDGEVKQLIDRSYGEAKRILTENKEKLEVLAQALLEYETLEAKHVMDIVKNGRLTDPPKIDRPPDLPPEEEEPSEPKPRKTREEEPGFPGDLEGAPAGA
ncbi:MAG: ATP-dependent zinc metalloprotease FtsH [Verrucomicrobiales bacterium]